MNIKITKKQKDFLGDSIKDLDELLAAGEVNDLLLAIDDAIIETFDEDGYPNETGNQLQKIYDEIYLMYESSTYMGRNQNHGESGERVWFCI